MFLAIPWKRLSVDMSLMETPLDEEVMTLLPLSMKTDGEGDFTSQRSFCGAAKQMLPLLLRFSFRRGVCLVWMKSSLTELRSCIAALTLEITSSGVAPMALKHHRTVEMNMVMAFLIGVTLL